MPKPRQPIDTEREDLSKNRIDDADKREASPLDLEDDDLDVKDSDFEEEDDMDY